MVGPGDELNEDLAGISDERGRITVAGFGSLLSKRSALSTFPELQNFRLARVRGFRRIFAHTASVFFERGIARPETGEISSLSCEECNGQQIIVVLFEIESTEASRQAFVEREHEFRFLAVQTEDLEGRVSSRLAVLCGRWDDASYRKRRCPPQEFERRYSRFGIDRVWRAYLRHCILASKNLGEEAHSSFMDNTFLADRKTTIREYMAQNADIMHEQLPPLLAARYGG